MVLARSVGLPARVVSGWAIGATDWTQTVYSDQAHQWAEVPFDRLGLGDLRADGSGRRSPFKDRGNRPPGPCGA